jgi:hypothetical protein
MLTLTVSHHIYLTTEQRSALLNGEQVETTGVSVPVWFYQGNTSEPATEVFCKYVLTTERENYPITPTDVGYRINLPVIPEGHKIRRLHPDQASKLTLAQQEAFEKKHPCPPSVADLLEPEKGGLGQLFFRRYEKIKEEGRRMNAVHSVTISKYEKLLETIDS